MGIPHEKNRRITAVFTNNSYTVNDFWFSHESVCLRYCRSRDHDPIFGISLISRQQQLRKSSAKFRKTSRQPDNLCSLTKPGSKSYQSHQNPLLQIRAVQRRSIVTSPITALRIRPARPKKNKTRKNHQTFTLKQGF